MNLRFLETFVWVARMRNFSMVAEKMNTTQAAVSKRIASLEFELGIRLFDRDQRAVTLTAEGQRVLADTEEIIRKVGALKRLVGDHTQVRGTLTLGAAEALVYAGLPKLMQDFKARYPNVTLNLVAETSLNLAKRLQDGSIDLALLMGPIAGPHLRNIDIGSFDCIWVGAPSLGLSRRRLRLEDLRGIPIFAFSNGSLPHQALLHEIELAGLDARDFSVANSNSFAATCRLVEAGVAVAILPDIVVREAIHRRELVALDVDVPLLPLSFHAVYAESPGNDLPGLLAEMATEIGAAGNSYPLREGNKPEPSGLIHLS